MNNSQLLTVAEVARLYKKAVQTVYRHIKAGKLSRGDNGLIALSECLRVYGSMPSQADGSVKHEDNNTVTHSNFDVIALLQQKIADLDNSVTELKSENKELKLDAKELRAEFLARENRLLAILENKSGVVANRAGGLFAKLFK